jgi:hypothetical protein
MYHVINFQKQATQLTNMAQPAIMFMFATLFVAIFASPSSDFLVWFSKNGGHVHGITVNKASGMGYGIVATKEIAANDLTLSVPHSLVLSRETLEKDPLIESYKQFPLIDDAMVAWLCLQRSLGANSFWQPYLKVLPQKVHVCQHFTNDELSLLQTPAHEAACLESRNKELLTFQTFVPRYQVLVAQHIAANPTHNTISANDISFEDYLWGKTMLWSRAWTVAGKRYLVPVADMFNYAPLAEVRQANLGSNFLNFHSITGDHERVWSDRSCNKGEQLFEDYGDNRNLVYLLNHGFVPDLNPFSSAMVPVDVTSLATSEHDKNIRRDIADSIASGFEVEVTADVRYLSKSQLAVMNAMLRLARADDQAIDRLANLAQITAESINEQLEEIQVEPGLLVPFAQAKLDSFSTPLQVNFLCNQFLTKFIESIRHNIYAYICACVDTGGPATTGAVQVESSQGNGHSLSHRSEEGSNLFH